MLFEDIPPSETRDEMLVSAAKVIHRMAIDKFGFVPEKRHQSAAKAIAFALDPDEDNKHKRRLDEDTIRQILKWAWTNLS